MEPRRVYFDHAVTTPVRSEVLEAMLPYLGAEFGNPQSLHAFGEAPSQALETARRHVASLVGAEPDEIVFTSSGAETNNLAVVGTARASRARGSHAVASSIEHFSVLHPLRALEKNDFEVTYLPVDRTGLVDPDDLRRALRPDTVFVSVMSANNEIGTVEPVAELAAVTHEHSDAVFHTDAVAMAGTLPLDVGSLGVDLLTLSGHHFYGPKGAAALFVKRGVRLMPMIEGGIQEGGRRAGTENVAGIAGLGRAAELAAAEMERRAPRLTKLREALRRLIEERVEHVVFTGHPDRRLPGHVSLCVEFIEGEAMLMMLNARGVAAASGSTCTSRALKASHVLLALGLPPEIVQGSLVLSLGEASTEDEAAYFAEVFPPIVERLRAMSPLYTTFLKERGET